MATRAGLQTAARLAEEGWKSIQPTKYDEHTPMGVFNMTKDGVVIKINPDGSTEEVKNG